LKSKYGYHLIMFNENNINKYIVNNDNFFIRFAPSPTGDMQVGNAYILSWNLALLSKNNNARFLLRFDDTDSERNIKGKDQKIINILKNFGVSPDLILFQSERNNFYRFFASELLKNNYLFYCDCKEEVCNCESLNLTYGALRLKNAIFTPANDLLFPNFLYPQINKNIILVRSNGMPTYHLACTVDDFLCKINIIVRANEWLPYINVHSALFDIYNIIFKTNYAPEFLHLPLILDEQGRKLSKRHGALSLEEILQQGLLPDALINYFLYISSKTEKEIFSPTDIDVNKIRRTSPKFDLKKILWFNRKYLQSNPVEYVLEKFTSYINNFFPNIKLSSLPVNISAFVQASKRRFSEFKAFLDHLTPLKWNKTQVKKRIVELFTEFEETNNILYSLRDKLSPENEFLPQQIQVLRFICTGNLQGFPINELFSIFHKEYMSERISLCIEIIEKNLLK